MKDTKTAFRFFSITQWKKEQDYLRTLHQQGWKFVSVSLIGLYHFQRCEPEDIIYQLDYNPDGIAHREEYVQLFRDCGWEYLQDYTGYSYFRKPIAEMDGEEEIFCDDASRLDMMKRVFQGRMIPLFIIFFLLILPNLYTQSRGSDPSDHVLTLIFSILLIVYMISFLHFWLQYRGVPEGSRKIRIHTTQKNMPWPNTDMLPSRQQVWNRFLSVRKGAYSPLS